ncbi:MAG: hypothetical protein Q9165_003788 [Trypethelium subeluteriae]
MFCATLRRRPTFASTIQTLTSRTGLNLRENLLETYDLEIPLSPAAPSSTAPARRIRILLLSPSSCDPQANLSATLSRIERLGHKTGGRDIAIVFLLSRARTGFASARELVSITNTTSTAHLDAAEQSHDGTAAFTALQAELLLRPEMSMIPVLPLPSLQSLVPVVKQYVSSLARPPPSLSPASGLRAPTGQMMSRVDVDSDVVQLLARCTVRPPLSRQTVYVVSDLVPSLRALARCAIWCGESGSEGMSEGEEEVVGEQMRRLREFLGEDEVRGMMEFWLRGWAVE